MLYECRNTACVYRNGGTGLCSLRERDTLECGEYCQSDFAEEDEMKHSELTPEWLTRFVDRAKLPPKGGYAMSFRELMELANIADSHAADAVSMAFDYGFARGYRLRMKLEKDAAERGGHAA